MFKLCDLIRRHAATSGSRLGYHVPTPSHHAIPVWTPPVYQASTAACRSSNAKIYPTTKTTMDTSAISAPAPKPPTGPQAPAVPPKAPPTSKTHIPSPATDSSTLSPSTGAPVTAQQIQTSRIINRPTWPAFLHKMKLSIRYIALLLKIMQCISTKF